MGKEAPQNGMASEAKEESFTHSGALGHGGRLGVHRWCPNFTHCKALAPWRLSARIPSLACLALHTSWVHQTLLQMPLVRNPCPAKGIKANRVLGHSPPPTFCKHSPARTSEPFASEIALHSLTEMLATLRCQTCLTNLLAKGLDVSAP